MGEMTPNYRASTDFLEWAQPGGPWVLVAIRTDKSGIETKTLTSVDDVVGWLGDVGPDSNIYWTVNSTLQEMESKPGRKDIKSLDFLHVDIDPRAGKDLDEERDLISQRLEGFQPQPSAVIFSGGGYQAFWRLQEPPRINGKEDAYEDAKRYNMQLERLLGGDNCHNVDRIMRLPGRPTAQTRRRWPRVGSRSWPA